MKKMRLIDADKLIQAIHEGWDNVPVWDESGATTAIEFERLVDSAPTIDAEPVVRCGDCKYFQCNVPPDGYLPIGADEYDCRYWGKLCDPEDFCFRGERRDSDETD